MKKLFTISTIVLAVVALTVSCKKSPKEKVEDGFEEVGDGIKDGANEAGDHIKEGYEEVKDEVDDATDAK
ncbi:hypothetical protein [Wenyingzhuangia aestuarii]|uniref:hypothetical protein n=1 Tax=Wenyingzhuangia aestuarii TaxID=1647582 RepID=UPI00143AE94C|nr:hypothetical protein [Wenyingzhuangia aestuarii]NJB81830.1 hypothetical protein [Wenyingzhuangia aestuarii]